MEQVYSKKTRFMFDIRDLFYLARNLDKLREYTGDPDWTSEREGDDTILCFHHGELLSKTTYVDDNPPTYLRAKVVITGLEEFPFDLEVILQEKGKNQTIVEYRSKMDIPEEYSWEAMSNTINEFRKGVYDQFVQAAKRLEVERRSQETSIPYTDLDD